MDDITKRSDRDLLVELIGERNTTVLYNNTLRPLFCAEESAPAYANSGHGCWRRPKTEPPRRLKTEPGVEAARETGGCG